MILGDAIDSLVSEFQASGMSRRGFLARATGLGLSATAAAALLAAAPRSAGAAPAGGARPAGLARQDAPVSGGTLREGYDLDFSRMDPINTSWYDPGFYALYESIITQDPDGNFVPQIAESWEVSEDGKTVTFVVRDGLKFHSGDPLNAASVKAVYDAIKDPASGSPLAVLFTPVETIDAPDDKTVVLNMAHPYFQVLNVVKTGYWDIVNTNTRTELGAEYGKQVIDGSGPFTFGEWVPGSHVTVNRWDEYPGSVTPFFENKGVAYLDGIRWNAILEQSQRAVQIENAEIDTLHAPSFSDVARLKENTDLNVITLKEWSAYIFGLNAERVDLDFHEVKMRQAISHSIDRAAIAQALLFGEGEPLYGPITTADNLYEPEVEKFNQFDLDAAKALVAELGWAANGDGILEKNGTKLAFTIVTEAVSEHKQLGEVLQAMLAELGADVTVESLDRGSFFGKLGEGVDSHIFFYLWPVPIDIIQLFIGTATIPGPNWSRQSIAVVDAGIEAVQNAANAEELAVAASQLQLAVAENLPVIPIINRNNVWVTRKNVRGYLPNQWNLYPYYSDVWLEQ